MNRVENLNQEMEKTKIALINKNNQLRENDKKLFDIGVKKRKLERDIEEHNINIPNRMDDKLKSSIGLGIAIFVITIFSSSIVSSILVTNLLTAFINSVVLGTIVSIPSTLLSYVTKTSRDRDYLRNFNITNIRKQLTELSIEEDKLKNDKIHIKSDIIKLNIQKDQIERELKNIINSSMNNQNINEYYSQFENDLYSNRQR